MKKVFGMVLTLIALGALAGTEPELRLEDHVFKTNKDIEVPAELGRITVKENRKNPHSRDIEVAFVRFKSTVENPASPIVYLAGGPGGSGVWTAKGSRFGLFMEMREVGDVIAYDQRGTGLSTRLPSCPQSWAYPTDEPLTKEKMVDLQRESARTCAAFWKEQGVDLNGYNTLESAHDLDALRQALGVEKISLWGISYGTHLALAYVRYYPDRVDKLLLAGLEGPDHTVKLPADSQALMEEIDRMAQAEGYTFLDDVKVVLDRLEKQPVEITAIARTGARIPLTIGKFDVQVAASRYLGGPSRFKALPAFFRDMKKGDFSSISSTILSARSGGIRGMSAAMDAASYGSPQRIEKVRAQAETTLLSGAINYPYVGLADALGIDEVDTKFRSHLQSNLHALFISGTLDGRTAVNNAVELLKGFPNARHLVIHGAGHSDPLFLSSPEIGEIMMTYMKDGLKEDREIQLPPMSFKVREAIRLQPNQLKRLVGSYKMENGGPVQISADANHLVVDVTGMGIFNFFPTSPTGFFMKDAPVELTFSIENDKVKGLVIQVEGMKMKAAPVTNDSSPGN